ncbi:hypothetical protein ACFS07_36265 [Undibacterium arcticum]
MLEHAAVHNDAWNEKHKKYMRRQCKNSHSMREGFAQFRKTEIMEFGVPCESSSSSGMAKNGNKIAEAHEHTGHLVVAGLIILAKVNPAIVIYECVPNYFFQPRVPQF